jgi:SnoaL-like domain
VDEAAIREALVRHWQYGGRDEYKAHEIYHDDAVLEFPQSGERFFGKSTFLAWRRQYPAKLDFRIRRITSEGDLWVVENLISYDGGPWMFTVSILRFRGDRVAHEASYIMDGWDAAPWRGEWATPFDRLASVAPNDWRVGEPFGIGPLGFGAATDSQP